MKRLTQTVLLGLLGLGAAILGIEVWRAREVWRKKFGSLPATPQEKAKQIRFLAGRGFSLTVIQRALKDIDLDDYPQD